MAQPAGDHQLRPILGTFLRELQTNATQQAASQYMRFCRPDAESLLAENDFQRLAILQPGRPGARVADEAVRAQYRRCGCQGDRRLQIHYRASPLLPTARRTAGLTLNCRTDAEC